MYRRVLLFTGLFWLLGFGSTAQAGTLSLSSAVVSPGGSATLSLTLAVSGTAPADLEWTVSYSPAQISAISFTPGPAASAATKTLSCNSGSGAATCVLTGLNTNTIGSGVIAYLTATIAPGTASASIQVSNPIGSDPIGDGENLSSVGGTITASTLSAVTCSPATLTGGATSSCAVTLTQAAPTGGSIVTLASNNASLTVPASVTVSTGATTASFIATAAASIASSQTATVTATLGGSSQTAAINLTAPASVLVSGVACNPSSLGPNAASICTVTLTQVAGAGGSTVTLTSNNTSLTVPASVTVAAGATSSTFSASSTATFTGNQSATVTATLGSSPQTTVVTTLGATPAFVQEKDNQVISGQTSSATFSSPTSAGNLVVVYLIWDNTGTASVSDSHGNTYAAAMAPTRWNNSAYSVQTFYAINLASGTDTVTATFATAVNQFGIVYAHEYSGVLQTAPMDVTVGAAGASGSLNTGAAATTNNIDLLFAGGVSATVVTGPGSGFVVRSTSQGNITEDQIVSAKGSYSGTASNSTGSWAMQMVAFKAAAGGATDTTPPTVPSGLSVTGTTTSTVSLAWTASVDNVGVTGYKVYRGGVQIGTSSAASYTDTGLAASTAYTYTVSAYDAAGNTSARSASVPATTLAPVLVSGVACNPATLGQSAVSTCTVTMTQVSPAGGSSVTLASNNASLTVPAAVTVAAGATTSTFSATAAASIASNQTVTVTATLGTSSKATAINLLAPVLVSGVTCNPATLGQNGVSSCTITLTQTAPVSGSSVALASNNASLTVPATVTVASGATTATFSATAAASIASNQTATVTATLGTSSKTTAINLLAPVLVSGVTCNPATLGQNAISSCTVTLTQVSPAGGSSVTLASNNASLTVPASVIVAAGATTATFGATAAALIASNQTATVTATLGTSSKAAAINLVAPASVLISGVACLPATLGQSAVATCTVTMTQVSPAGGSSVTLASNNASLTVPAAVTVAAGATTATFSATAAASIASNQTATITATFGVSSQTASVSLMAPVLVSGVACNPATLGQSAVATCTVTMTQVSPAGGSSVTLASNNASLTVPAAVTVASGATTATFSATAAASIASNQTATVTATFGASSQTASVSLLAPVLVSGVACNPATLGQSAVSTCALTMTQISPAGGSSVTLASNNASLTVPATVTVAAGATTATFSATAAASIASNQTATVTATFGVSSRTASVSLLAPVLVSGVACNPATLGQSAVATCTVTMTQGSPAGGSSVSLASNNASLTVPATVTVAAGATTATFTAKAAASIASNQTATVTATFGVSSQTTSVSLMAPVLVSGVACNPATLGQSAVATCTVTMTQISLAGGSSVTLASNNASLTVPATVTVAAGATTATFGAVAAASIASNQTATITATFGGSSQTTTVSLVVSVSVLVSGIACNPATLGQSAVATCTLTMTQVSPAGGSSVTLASNNASLTVPATVTVASGTTTATFSATAAATFTGNQSATITATFGGSSQTVIINSASLPVFIQEKDNQVISGKTSAATFSSPTTAGNLIVVYLIWDNSGTASVSDSLGNKYAAAVAPTRWSGQYSVQTFYTINLTGGSDKVTATFGTAINSFGIVYAHEYSGVLQTSPIDVTAAAAGTSGSLNSGSVTTTNNIDLLFAGGVSANVVTGAGASFTTRSTSQGNITEDRIVSVKGSYSATASNSGGGWAMQMVAFKGAAGGTSGTLLVSGLARANSGATASLSAPAAGAAAGRSAPSPAPSANTVSSLRCSPAVMTAGGTVSCELLTAASPQSVQIALHSNSKQVRIPAVVATRPNQSSLTFQAQSDPASSQQPVTITATSGSATVEDTVLVMGASGPVLRVPKRQVGKVGALLSFTVSATDPSDLPMQLEAAAIPAGASFDPVTGVFQWNPEASQAGTHRITFTAADSARQSSTAQTEIEVDTGLPVLNPPASSFSSGAIATLTGKWLAAPESRLSDPSGASFELGGTKVLVQGQPVPVLYSAADRVDFLCPVQAAGMQLSVEVVSGSGTSRPVTIGMQEAVPTILSLDDSEQNQGLISFSGMNDLAMERNYRVPSHPAQPGDQIVILATGLGSAADSSFGTMLVKLGDVYAAVESVQAVPRYAGVSAIRLQVPAAMSFGTAPVQLQITTPDGQQFTSNTVTAVFEAARQ